MKRITNENYKELGFYSYIGAQNPFKTPLTIGELAGCLNVDYSPRKILEDVFRRLAAYEDTGLEPEEVAELVSPKTVEIARLIEKMCKEGSAQRMVELFQAEKDGSMRVLPCGIGDVVYHIEKCENFQQILDGTMHGAGGGPGTATGCYCPCELAESCPFDAEDFDCGKNEKKLAIFEDEVVSFYIDENGTSIALGYSGSVSALDFGKTVFLTREEAGAALKKREVTNKAD